MLMLDCVGTSPAFSAGGGGGVGVAVVMTLPPVGTFGGGAGSEPQPTLTAVDRNRIAATYFMNCLLGRGALADWARSVYLVPRISGLPEKREPLRSGNVH